MARAREERASEVEGSRERSSAPGKEGRAGTFAAGQPMVADLASVEAALAGAPRREVQGARVEAQVEVPPGKVAAGGGGPAGAGGGGVGGDRAGGGAGGEGGAGLEALPAGERARGGRGGGRQG